MASIPLPLIGGNLSTDTDGLMRFGKLVVGGAVVYSVFAASGILANWAWDTVGVGSDRDVTEVV